ncbi:Hsp33 family molecular chaperone HslO [Hutsoniella sourekii]|uniref:Hsp33 family molecular chaperone HslO n=1 Tax=Hutsoniella sourekii TaxID=87650 RepID=UPI000480AD29|nr:Hsp33 family molecular chaperone HslO [Hutsoniella sourekii]
MQDQLIKALAFDNQIRVVILQARQAVQEACSRHDTWHTASAVLGRTMIASLLMASNLKGADRQVVEVKGSGPVGRVVAEVNANNQIRAYIDGAHVALELNPLGKIDVAGAVGLPGQLTVKKYIEQLDPYTGQVDLVSGELGEDFTYYMAASEQTPSAFGLSVLVNADESIQSAGGFMIQIMPGTSEETIGYLEARLGQIDHLAQLFDQANDLEEVLSHILETDNYKVLAREDLSFYCPCSKEEFALSLQLLDSDTLNEMKDEDHGAEVVCHYCGETYSFSEKDLIEILDKKEEE